MIFLKVGIGEKWLEEYTLKLAIVNYLLVMNWFNVQIQSNETKCMAQMAEFIFSKWTRKFNRGQKAWLRDLNSRLLRFEFWSGNKMTQFGNSVCLQLKLVALFEVTYYAQKQSFFLYFSAESFFSEISNVRMKKFRTKTIVLAIYSFKTVFVKRRRFCRNRFFLFISSFQLKRRAFVANNSLSQRKNVIFKCKTRTVCQWIQILTMNSWKEPNPFEVISMFTN